MKTIQTHLSMLWLIGLTVSAADFAGAEDVFFDDFSDGSVTNEVPLDRDGNPVVWTQLAGFEGTGDASSGDYVLTGVHPAFNSHNEIADTSIRAQVQLSDPQGTIGFFARTNDDGSAYQAGIRPSSLSEFGTAYIGRHDAPDATFRTLSFERANVDVFSGDVFLQFDVIGDEPTTLRLFAWEGDPSEKPELPLIELLDFDTPSSGGTGVLVNAPSDGGSGVFRFVHVADSPIPEPSTITLSVFALAAVTCLRQRTLST